MKLYQYVITFAATVCLCAPEANARLVGYGRLVGDYVRSNIDDDYTGTRHFEVFVRAPSDVAGSCPEWRIDINLRNLRNRIVPIFVSEVPDDRLTVWQTLVEKPSGFELLPFDKNDAKSGGLDLMRHPDVLNSIQGFSWSSTPLLQGSGAPATANRLTQLFRNARKIYAFGQRFENSEFGCMRQGLHNIHQNQGSSRSTVGPWQDGAIIVEHLELVPVYLQNTWQWIQVPRHTALYTQFNDQLDFATSRGFGLASFASTLNHTGSQRFGPYTASQLTAKATAVRLSPDDPHFSMALLDGAGAVLAISNGPDRNGITEFARTYNAGPVWIEVDTAIGSNYELMINSANE
jgi:hypothetical protein